VTYIQKISNIVWEKEENKTQKESQETKFTNLTHRATSIASLAGEKTCKYQT